MNPTSPNRSDQTNPSPTTGGGFSYAQLQAQQIAAAAATRSRTARRDRIAQQQRPGTFDRAAFEEWKQQAQRRRLAAARLPW